MSTTTVAYTVGHQENYDTMLRMYIDGHLKDVPTKLGFRPKGAKDFPDGYEGGAIWQSPWEALNFILTHHSEYNGYGVYELDCHGTWHENHGGWHPDGYHYLLKDACIVRRVSQDDGFDLVLEFHKKQVDHE